MINRVAIVALVGALVVPCSAMALTAYGTVIMSRWAAVDRCAAAAQKQFPDYTPEANAKRDDAMRRCLATGNLPPRGDLDH
jgi:hypothetical protein